VAEWAREHSFPTILEYSDELIAKIFNSGFACLHLFGNNKQPTKEARKELEKAVPQL